MVNHFTLLFSVLFYLWMNPKGKDYTGNPNPQETAACPKPAAGNGNPCHHPEALLVTQ